ncbi:MAG: hypothetical protein IPI46_04845 [Bacteroidetes bacterium]|nr:hypothetical protein [Bacteroidota bacterium]
MKTLLTSIILLILSTSIHACDMCGCSASGNSFGILPGFQKHFIGLRYQNSSFTSKAHEGSNESHKKSKEQYQSIQLWGRAVLHPKIHAFVFVPYKFNQRKEGSEQISIHGVGDISLLLNYILLNTGNQDSSNTKQFLQCGAGIKLPTGKCDAIHAGLMLNENMQIGTGSVDIPWMVMYTLRHKNKGLYVEANYALNNSNKFKFQFGNKLSTSFKLLRWFQKSKLTYLPQIGAGYEYSQIDRRQHETVENSGGSIALVNVGMDLYYRNFSLAVHAQQPIAQNIGNGLIQNKTRMSANLIYLF